MLIVADDFTGACDAAGAFAARAATRVVTRLPEGWPPDTEILSVDLDVRERSDSEAARAMAGALERLAAHREDISVFVKIDSTLRGPIVGLVDGALHATRRKVAVVCPAFPEYGRLIRNGRLVVGGTVAPGPSLVDRLRPLPARVIDAETTSSLAALARSSAAHPEQLLVGSAGLARQLALLTESQPPPPLGDRGEGVGGWGADPPSGVDPLLVVAGSPTSVTREQLTHLPRSPEVIIQATPPTDVRDQGEAAAALADAVIAWAAGHTPRAVVLTGGATAREVSHRLGATSLRLHGELQPGIPVGTLENGLWHGVTVVTKAGGFGTPRTLLDVVLALGVSSPAGA